MTQRDEEGRPIATRNAGAFLAPVGGVIPAPSSMLDAEGAAGEPVLDPRARGRLRLIALVTSVAVWTVLSAAFRYLLVATERFTDLRPRNYGEDMLQLMHSEWAWYLTSVVLVGVGVALAMRRVPGRTRRDWLLVAATSAVAVVAISLGITLVGGYAAAMLAVIATAWLLAVPILRRSAVRAA